MKINPITNTFLTFKSNKQEDIYETIKKIDEEACIDKEPIQDEFIKNEDTDNLIDRYMKNIKQEHTKTNSKIKINTLRPKDNISFTQD